MKKQISAVLCEEDFLDFKAWCDLKKPQYRQMEAMGQYLRQRKANDGLYLTRRMNIVPEKKAA